jgi:hypothetical protein
MLECVCEDVQVLVRVVVLVVCAGGALGSRLESSSLGAADPGRVQGVRHHFNFKFPAEVAFLWQSQ